MIHNILLFFYLIFLCSDNFSDLNSIKNLLKIFVYKSLVIIS